MSFSACDKGRFAVILPHEFHRTHNRCGGISDDRDVPSDSYKGGIPFRHEVLVGIPHSRHSRHGSLAFHGALHSLNPFRRLCILLFLEHTRSLRTAQEGRERLVSRQSETTRVKCAAIPSAKSTKQKPTGRTGEYPFCRWTVIMF